MGSGATERQRREKRGLQTFSLHGPIKHLETAVGRDTFWVYLDRKWSRLWRGRKRASGSKHSRKGCRGPPFIPGASSLECYGPLRRTWNPLYRLSFAFYEAMNALVCIFKIQNQLEIRGSVVRIVSSADRWWVGLDCLPGILGIFFQPNVVLDLWALMRISEEVVTRQMFFFMWIIPTKKNIFQTTPRVRVFSNRMHTVLIFTSRSIFQKFCTANKRINSSRRLCKTGFTSVSHSNDGWQDHYLYLSAPSVVWQSITNQSGWLGSCCSVF